MSLIITKKMKSGWNQDQRQQQPKIQGNLISCRDRTPWQTPLPPLEILFNVQAFWISSKATAHSNLDYMDVEQKVNPSMIWVFEQNNSSGLMALIETFLSWKPFHSAHVQRCGEYPPESVLIAVPWSCHHCGVWMPTQPPDLSLIHSSRVDWCFSPISSITTYTNASSRKNEKRCYEARLL